MLKDKNQEYPKFIFVTGTDTGVGKTHIAVNLLQTFNRQEKKTIGLKPIASGCTKTQDGLRNDDALQLQKSASIFLPYEKINPWAFEKPIAPHIAAKQNHVHLSVAKLVDYFYSIKKTNQVDIIIIEGAGGWLLPLNDHEYYADFVEKINATVVLVVGMRLGCLNHAILTDQSIRSKKLNCLGWVANCLGPEMTFIDETINTLKTHIPIPFLGKALWNSKLNEK